MRIRTIAIGGLAGAAAIAYLFDPKAGRARRSRLRERLIAFTQRRMSPAGRRSPLPVNMIPEPVGLIADAPEERTPEERTKEERTPETVAATLPERTEDEVAATPQERSKDEVADTSEEIPMDDAAIADRIRMRVLGQSDLEAGSLVIDVVRGVAFLRGDLEDRRQIDQIVDLTGAVPGVQSVRNLIHLPESPTISRPAARLGDAWNA